MVVIVDLLSFDLLLGNHTRRRMPLDELRSSLSEVVKDFCQNLCPMRANQGQLIDCNSLGILLKAVHKTMPASTPICSFEGKQRNEEAPFFIGLKMILSISNTMAARRVGVLNG